MSQKTDFNPKHHGLAGIEVEEIKEMEDMFVPWMATVT